MGSALELASLPQSRHYMHMVDTRTPAQRTAIMQSVGSKNTGPEIAIRRLIHRMGFRFRLHAKNLPGRPDIVFPSRKKIIFVHGCFWHGHGCKYGRLPKSRLEYWAPKIEANRKRDKKSAAALRRQKWSVLSVWQCQTKDMIKLEKTLKKFLEKKNDRQEASS